jgi:hypothetical protein
MMQNGYSIECGGTARGALFTNRQASRLAAIAAMEPIEKGSVQVAGGGEALRDFAQGGHRE